MILSTYDTAKSNNDIILWVCGSINLMFNCERRCAEGESNKPAKDKDDDDGASDTSSDSGNGSPDEFNDDRMDMD